MDGVERAIYITFTEKSIMQRKQLIRGTSSVNQLETMYMLTSAETMMTERSKTHHEGTNMGNVFGPVNLEHPDSMWSLPVKTKHQLYGDHRHRQGGHGEQ